VLYRPAQDCSRPYGIDPPRKSAFRDGIHTISSLGEATLIDVKRERFNPTDLWLKVRKLLRNVLNWDRTSVVGTWRE
jgi:hypothetical protein